MKSSNFESIKMKIARKVMNSPHNTYPIMSIMEFIDSEWAELNHLEDESLVKVDEIYQKVLSAHKKTKQRWFKKETADDGSLTKFLNQALFVLVEEDGTNKFFERYGYRDYQQFKEDRLEYLKKWAKHDKGLLCNFPYFNERQNWQKVLALKSDIRLLILDEFLFHEADILEEIVPDLNDWNFPMDHTSKVSFPESVDGDANVRSLTLNLGDLTDVRAELNLDEIKGSVYTSQYMFKLMNGWDLGIMHFLLYKLSKKRYRDVDITTTIKEILDFLKFPANGRNYDIVEASIRKLVLLTIFIKTPKRRFSLRFLEKYSVDETIPGQNKITITLNSDVYNQALDGKITNMYKNVIDSLSPAATAMIYRLQRMRIQKYLNNDTEPIQKDLEFFSSILILNMSRKNRARAVVEDALNEIIKQGVTLKSFEYKKGDIYILHLLPMNDKEKRDLLVNTDISIFHEEAALFEQTVKK